jgi:hypothetical protein
MLMEIKLQRQGNVRPLLNVSLFQLLVFHHSVQNKGKMRDINFCKLTCSVIPMDVSTWITQ